MKKLFTIICILHASFAFAQLNASLLASWQLDGNADDVSGHGYHGTLTGNKDTTDRFGSHGCATYLRDTNAYFQFYQPNQVNPFLFWGKDVTLSLWFKLDYHINLDKDAFLARHVWEYTQERMTNFSILLQPNDVINICQAIPQGTSLSKIWSHLVIRFVYDNGKRPTEVYLNNKLISSMVWPCHGGENFNAYLRLGENVGVALDDVRFYEKALSVAEIETLYNMPSSCTITGLEEAKTLSEENAIVRICDLMGREISNLETHSGFAIVTYADGSIKKIYK